MNHEDVKVIMEQNKTKQMRTLSGSVISNRMNKTIVVLTARTYRHPLLGKVMQSTKKCVVHDESQQAKIGDIVEFYEGKPLSKTKCRYLLRVVRSA